MKTGDPFKRCNCCHEVWASREAFLRDPGICINGYQANFEDLRAGLFLFSHSCKTTLALPAGKFADLYNGPIFEERKTGTEECPGYCLYKENLKHCKALCECAYVRAIIQIIREWKKEDGCNPEKEGSGGVGAADPPSAGTTDAEAGSME